MINFEEVKLIIWDLDETLWEGTISDNDSLKLNDNFVSFINNSLDRGIIHSICSKNDFDVVKEHLISLGLWELFVFSSINWNPKGKRIENIIKDMGLRAQNVLFVDDNISNLNEAIYYCPEIQICTPQELENVIDTIFDIEKVNKSRPRLKQYRLLEEKVKSQQNFDSNEDFLMSCNICIDFHYDCIENIERIHDLIMRSNQLNYTKFRQEKEELLTQLSSQNTKAAYITVKDSFGDYGIVGFYMIMGGIVKHYLFSCRTLGMLVEQYVYMQIGCPQINVIGDVITELNDTFTPPWINVKQPSSSEQKSKGRIDNQKILFKGPCDISQIFSFIAETPSIVTEFTYTNNQGISVEGFNHTSQLVTSLRATSDEKTKLVNATPWLDEEMFDASNWKRANAIVFSLLSDGNLGIYAHKETGWQISLCEKFYDLTDPKNWEAYINKKIFTSRISFSKEKLAEFAERFEYVNNEQGDITLNNLDILYNAMKKNSKLILLLGSEKPYVGPTALSYGNREVFHKILNDKIKKWAADKKNVYLIEIGKYITSQKDYLDTINHFQKKVYYYIAQDLLTILNSTEEEFKVKSKYFIYWESFKKRIFDLAVWFYEKSFGRK